MGIIRRKEVAFLKLMLGRRHILFRILNIEETFWLVKYIVMGDYR